MRPRTALAVGLLLLSARSAPAQSLIELRGSTTQYRFVDFTHTFKSAITTDLLYLGAPGSDELYLGAGYAWKPAGGVNFTPLLYFVAGKQSDERGLALCLSVFVDRAGWRVLGFGGRFFRLAGGVPDYDFLDSLDLTRVVAKCWEIGVSGGFLHSGESWNPLVGPTLKLSDRLGTTALAVRGGYRSELRLIRTFSF